MSAQDGLLVTTAEDAPRLLDTTEGIFWVYERQRTFRAAHTAVIEGPLDEALLQQAALRLQARQPKLRVLIVPGESGPRFVPTALTPTVWVRHNVPCAQWPREAERELNAPTFGDGELPWRIGLLRGESAQGPHAVVLTVHHSLTDGLGSLRLIDQLLTACAEVARGETEAPRSAPPAPTLDSALAPAPTRRELLRHRARNLARRLRRQPERLLPFEGVAAPTERRTGVLFRELPAALFREFHQQARAARVSINGALTVLTLDAIGAIIGSAGGSGGELAVSTQVSLRSRCQPQVSADHVGCYVSNVVTRHALSDKRSLWVRAAEITAAVQRPLQAREPQIALRAGRGRLAALERSLSLIAADPNGQGRLGPLSLSNRGPVRVAPSPPFVLRALFSPVSLHVLGPCLQVSFGTMEDQLCCTFSYPRPLLRERTVNAIAHALVQRIQMATHTQDLGQRRAS